MVVYVGADLDAPITSNTSHWWNVIEMGYKERRTMLAFNPMKGVNERDTIFLRQRHEVWTEWIKIVGQII